MATKFETFKALHSAKDLFILPNAWDAESASILERNNFSAVGTSSAAVATMLGYADGEEMPLQEYLLIIRRIAASVTIPFTVDFEMGYGKTKEAIYTNIEKLLEAGVAGINIEDSKITNGARQLREAKEFAQTVEFIKNKLSKSQMSLFINLRCDTYLLDVKEKRKETTERLKLYENAGADGIFLPFIKNEEDIKKAVADTKLPLNVMALPGLPETGVLNDLGVKRLSMGPFLRNKTYSTLSTLAREVFESKNIKPII